ncbi:MAG: transketolase [Candidatus Dependentiae bacterium]|nr:transketolase [Candidatus Dependentiae bacterium]
MSTLKKFLEHNAYQLRVSSLKMTTVAGSGHPTSALSAADLVSALFFYAMRYERHNPDNQNNDRFILSKGHASPVLYAAWKEAGVLTEDELLTYRKFDSVLEGHPTLRFPWSEAATGSLGMGLSIGAGMALSGRLDKRNFKTYVLMGDSEVAEGSVWEAAEIAAYYKLNNLIGLVDCNRLGQSTETMHGHHAQRYANKFQAFGWNTIIVDGHDMEQIMGALDKAREHQEGPTIIIAKTLKGYGIDVAQDKEGFHGKSFSKDELPGILENLKQRFLEAAQFDDAAFAWQPTVPEKSNGTEQSCLKELTVPHYTLGEQVATRFAYGHALRAAGVACNTVVSLDAEVKNSTGAEFFEEKFPDRFFQCFIAEQNMVSMGVGLNRRGKIPFISTFGCFLTRAHDQIRMAAIGSATLRLVGSHAGVSIGEDGPSQMALEDIAQMRALPNSIVLYPSDAMCTYRLVEQMVAYDRGISYLRTTRMTTPVIYDWQEEFYIGGCKVVRQSDEDQLCIVGAGVTLFEALKAYEKLQEQLISVAVIDLYSIKPLDHETIIKVAQASGKKLITVEDHYLQGGLGEAVTYALRNADITIECLAVTQLPRSGKPQELLAWAGIDAAGIVKKALALLGRNAQ